jgi:hypothetical protein
MPEEKRDPVKVTCGLPNGIELRVYGPGHDDGTGTGNAIAPRVVDSFVLRGPSAVNSGVINPAEPVVNDVPADFWDAWTAQNEKQPPTFLSSGQIAVIEKQDG